MDRTDAERLLPIFLNAVCAMALATDHSLKERHAWVAADIVALTPPDIPASIKQQFNEYVSLVTSARVPAGLERHPKYTRSTRAYYISWQKARKAANLLTSMLEQLVYAALPRLDPLETETSSSCAPM